MKNILRDGDVISGAVLAALGTFIFMQARAWDYYGPDGPGPGFFPAWYGIAMVVLSLVLIAGAILKNRQQDGIDWPGTGRALTTWLAFVGAIVLMEWLGFLISFALLTFFIVAFIFRQPSATAGITAVGAAIGFYVTFAVMLSVSLPTGVFGF